jgi:peptide-methionine (S)-S-oxide reductase
MMLTKSLSTILSFFILLFYGCSGAATQDIKGKDGFAVLPAVAHGEQVANFAGGCFWATQASMLQLKGVKKVISGYAGGTMKDPTYDNVLSGNTGHAESVQVYYDPKVISFGQLADAFFHAHDPTQLDGQGPDIGSDYRSIAFYRNVAEHKVLLALLKKMAAQYPDPVVTELTEFQVFYPAEMEHQDYYARNPWDFYIRKVSRPKVLKLQKSMPELIKTEYLE